MKKLLYSLVLILIFASGNGQTKFWKPTVNPSEVQKTYLGWNNYQKSHIMLSTDFVALDAKSNPITKAAFLQELTSGNYIPIQLESDSAALYYQLFKIEPTSDTSIKASIAETAFNEIQNYKKEGEPFPAFSFKDLEGNLITNETLKGKIVVIKCWYIHCAACLKEFPEVNQLVANYKDRTDIVFVSLAEDTAEQLAPFLVRKPLSYAVVPDMKTYMNLTLQLNAFPTHYIINKEGIIVKVLSDFKSLEAALGKISSEK
ncbi:TlpA disulfide reductase family protein [Flavobacterium sp. PL002]|uniref:TlpA family protein disulfide reductase n=1 Tax=Flavobacterium sp. PL002 TaxID=1897058 RepID=UPI001787F396|nr:TlpA disulfide reductase family protein [Flavobacterium sp. PL002]MBE0391768.1 Thiol-disulfide oxidoreductase ResA [Flavobacterium sp. PL002]